MGIIQVLEMFLLLFICLRYLGLGKNISVINMFFFTEIIFFGLLKPIIVRENDFFWRHRPGRTLSLSIMVYFAVDSVLSLVGFGIISMITHDNNTGLCYSAYIWAFHEPDAK